MPSCALILITLQGSFSLIDFISEIHIFMICHIIIVTIYLIGQIFFLILIIFTFKGLRFTQSSGSAEKILNRIF